MQITETNSPKQQQQQQKTPNYELLEQIFCVFHSIGIFYFAKSNSGKKYLCREHLNKSSSVLSPGPWNFQELYIFIISFNFFLSSF